MSDIDAIDTAVKIITALTHATGTRTMYADSLLQVLIAVDGAERAASAMATVAASVVIAAAELVDVDPAQLTKQIGMALSDTAVLGVAS